MENPGWDDILDKGEEILWQGRPDTGMHFRPRDIPIMIFGLIFAGFALFWMIGVAQVGGAFWAFGLLHFSLGMGLLLSPLLWGPFRRARTWYTLTNRRAFIATDLPLLGKKLKSYPITDDTILEFTAGDLSSLHFSKELRRGDKGRTYLVPVGFEYIRDGNRVYRMMRDIQEQDRLRNEAGHA